MNRVQCFEVVLFEEEGKTLARRVDTGEVRPGPSVFGPGAMWHNLHYEEELAREPYWLKHIHLGPDGHVLLVVLPNGNIWNIDSRCSNCTMPDDNEHACWVRHGEIPNITVDKNGKTCGAGAGSILSGSYHGFLREGVLIEC